MTPLEDFLTAADKGDDERLQALAQNRMFTKAIEAVDRARGLATAWTLVLRHGRESVSFSAYGPYATRAKATEAAAGFDYTGIAVVPTLNPEGLKELWKRVDEPTRDKGDWALIREDSQLYKKGWKGANRNRQEYVA